MRTLRLLLPVRAVLSQATPPNNQYVNGLVATLCPVAQPRRPLPIIAETLRLAFSLAFRGHRYYPVPSHTLQSRVRLLPCLPFVKTQAKKPATRCWPSYPSDANSASEPGNLLSLPDGLVVFGIGDGEPVNRGLLIH